MHKPFEQSLESTVYLPQWKQKGEIFSCPDYPFALKNIRKGKINGCLCYIVQKTVAPYEMTIVDEQGNPRIDHFFTKYRLFTKKNPLFSEEKKDIQPQLTSGIITSCCGEDIDETLSETPCLLPGSTTPFSRKQIVSTTKEELHTTINKSQSPSSAQKDHLIAKPSPEEQTLSDQTAEKTSENNTIEDTVIINETIDENSDTELVVEKTGDSLTNQESLSSENTEHTENHIIVEKIQSSDIPLPEEVAEDKQTEKEVNQSSLLEASCPRLEQIKKKYAELLHTLPKQQKHIKTSFTQDLLEYFADALGVPSLQTNIKNIKEEKLFSQLRSHGAIGNALIDQLKSPLAAFSLITTYIDDQIARGIDLPEHRQGSSEEKVVDVSPHNELDLGSKEVSVHTSGPIALNQSSDDLSSTEKNTITEQSSSSSAQSNNLFSISKSTNKAEQIEHILETHPQLQQEILHTIQTTITPEEQSTVSSIAKKISFKQFFALDSIKHIISKISRKNYTSLLEKIPEKIRMIGGISLILSSFLWYYYSKQKVNQTSVPSSERQTLPTDTIPNNNDSTSTYYINPETLTLEELSSCLSDKHLAPGVSRNDILQTINKIANPSIKLTTIDALRHDDIVRIKTMLGLKIDSKYTSNKADSLLNSTTIKRLSDPLLYLHGDELLNHPQLASDVKEVYAKFWGGQIPNLQKPYLIVSKNTASVYLFDKDNHYLYSEQILLGKDLGKSGEWVPYPYIETDNGRIGHNKPVNTNTPEGIFGILASTNLQSNYHVDGPAMADILIPLSYDTTNGYQPITTYDHKHFHLGLHPMYIPGKDDTYQKAYMTDDIKDNAISHGCINIGNFGIIHENIEQGGIVYITSYHK